MQQYIPSFTQWLNEAIIDWDRDLILDFQEEVHHRGLPIRFDDLVQAAELYGIEVVSYDQFYNELPDDEYRESAPPRGVPAFASVNPVTYQPRIIVNVPTVDRRLFDYIIHMLKHEMVHIGQWSRRDVHPMGPSPTDRAAYFSNRDEVMAFSQSIVDQLISMGIRRISELEKMLPQVKLYQEIKKTVDLTTLKRYHKYIYLYLERELEHK